MSEDKTTTNEASDEEAKTTPINQDNDSSDVVTEENEGTSVTEDAGSTDGESVDNSIELNLAGDAPSSAQESDVNPEDELVLDSDDEENSPVSEVVSDNESSISTEESSEDTEATHHDDEGVEHRNARIGYTGEILGELVTLDSLEQETESTQADHTHSDDLVKLIDGSLSKVSQDEIVTGRVISVGEKDVVIDIGFKSDGVISKGEFDGEVSEGDEVEVYLERLENYHGQLVLSKDRAEQIRRWERVEEAYENGTILEGVIVRRIKGGMSVNLLDGLEAFLPGSQIDVRPVRDFDSYLDVKMEFKIVKINAENENVVVSHKALIERELASQRESILATMEKGQVLEGVAKNITDFGVFVDLGGVDGLLHITDLTWGRVSHPTEILELDQEIKVVVLEYDKERQRISLGLKQLQPHPWDNIEERYKPGQGVEGKVVSITDYGAFLELEQGIEGLVHVSEMSWTGNIRHPSQRVSLGQIVKVSVLSIDHDTQKISLGMKQFEVNPWEGIALRYPPGTVLRGSVRNMTHFGAFVEIEPGIDGLVHVSDLSWTKNIRHPSEVIKRKQDISVVVLDVDEKRQRIALGHKQIETNPWTNLSMVYEKGSDHKGKVIRIDRKGLAVELPLEVEGFVPGSELKNKYESGGFPPYQEGDMLDLRVIRLDVNKKEIIMSETAKERQKEARARQNEQRAKRAERRQEERAVRRHEKREKVASGPTTIGELSGLESIKEKMQVEEQNQEVAATAEESSLKNEDVVLDENETEEASASEQPEVEDSLTPDEESSEEQEKESSDESEEAPSDESEEESSEKSEEESSEKSETKPKTDDSNQSEQPKSKSNRDTSKKAKKKEESKTDS